MCGLVSLMLAAARSRIPAQDSVAIRIVNSDLRAAVQLLGQYLDRPVLFSGQGNMPVTLEAPRKVPRTDVVRLLRGLLDSQGYELVDDTAATLYRVRPRERVPTMMPVPPATQRPTQGTTELFVIALKHARAADVAQTVNALYVRIQPSGDSLRVASSLGDDLRENRMAFAGAPAPEVIPGAAGRSATFSGEVAIVPDARANNLLVRANRADFELIEAVVQQLDVRPLQALIEVLIAEVRRDRSLGVGADAMLPQTMVGKSGASLSAKGGAGGNPGLAGLVIDVLGAGGLDLDASLRLAAERGDVRILSRPVVLTANNERAEIVVGSQRPFVQLSRALPTDAVVRDQIVQYKDVGTKLSVRPTISGDGSVQLEVAQEVSSATSETQFNAPVISTRSVRTQLLVHDGQTIVLGGLTDREREATQGGLPLLSSLPFLGGLFGHGSRRTSETELFLFLTPRVIRTDDDAARISAPLRQRADRVKP
jgi:general secretion pathway protein D